MLDFDELEALVIEAMDDALKLPEFDNMRVTRVVAIKLKKKLEERYD